MSDMYGHINIDFFITPVPLLPWCSFSCTFVVNCLCAFSFCAHEYKYLNRFDNYITNIALCNETAPETSTPCEQISAWPGVDQGQN